MQGRKTVSIGGQVTHINISKPAPRAFANPNMTIYLKKNGRIYDSYHASYSGGTVPETARTGKDRPWLIAGVLIILIAAAGIIIWRQQA
ncbi:MAG: hypothetical protein SVU32_01480 [Candidatus Nanohaloarchaea archaeon]|nr:hypothetical protein [Candidatus Nanohaloarchaea archaeon]